MANDMYYNKYMKYKDKYITLINTHIGGSTKRTNLAQAGQAAQSGQPVVARAGQNGQTPTQVSSLPVQGSSVTQTQAGQPVVARAGQNGQTPTQVSSLPVQGSSVTQTQAGQPVVARAGQNGQTPTQAVPQVSSVVPMTSVAQVVQAVSTASTASTASAESPALEASQLSVFQTRATKIISELNKAAVRMKLPLNMTINITSNPEMQQNTNKSATTQHISRYKFDNFTDNKTNDQINNLIIESNNLEKKLKEQKEIINSNYLENQKLIQEDYLKITNKYNLSKVYNL